MDAGKSDLKIWDRRRKRFPLSEIWSTPHIVRPRYLDLIIGTRVRDSVSLTITFLMECAEEPGFSSWLSTVDCASSSAQAVSGTEVILRHIGNQRQAGNGSESNLPEVQRFVYEENWIRQATMKLAYSLLPRFT